MASLNIFSFNCYGVNTGTLNYLREKCMDCDMLLLQDRPVATFRHEEAVSSSFLVV